MNDVFINAIDLFVPVSQVSYNNITLSGNTLTIKKKFHFLCRKLRTVRFLEDAIIKTVKAELKLVKLMLFEAIKIDISSYYANLLLNLNDTHSSFHTVGARRKSNKGARDLAVSDTEEVVHEGDDRLSQLFVEEFYGNHSLSINDQTSMASKVNRAASLWRDKTYIRFSNECSALPNELRSYPSELVAMSEVLEVIASRNNKLSAGVDNMPNRIIKLFNRDIIAILVTVFNQLIPSGYFPDSWNLSVLSGWRPISLLQCVAKIFERLLAVRIRKFLSNSKIIPSHQFAFMPGHSTCHPLAILQNKINKNLNNGIITSTVYLDVQAAFDTVWQEGLVYKLHMMKLPVHLISIMKSFLTNRKLQSEWVCV